METTAESLQPGDQFRWSTGQGAYYCRLIEVSKNSIETSFKYSTFNKHGRQDSLPQKITLPNSFCKVFPVVILNRHSQLNSINHANKSDITSTSGEDYAMV